MPSNHPIQLTLPPWTETILKEQAKTYKTLKEKIALANQLALENIKHETGGPFGAAIFHQETHQLISIGVNRVVPLNQSIAHAEILAIAWGQEQIKHYDLGKEGPTILVSSAQPCIMCLGALHWSGIKAIAYSANKKDVEEILGFDEGPVPSTWSKDLKDKGIELFEEISREEGIQVLKRYQKEKGEIYNPQK